jgi:hypothetical protein
LIFSQKSIEKNFSKTIIPSIKWRFTSAGSGSDLRTRVFSSENKKLQMRVKNEERIPQKLHPSSTNWGMSPPSSFPNWAVGFCFLGEGVSSLDMGGVCFGQLKTKKKFGQPLKTPVPSLSAFKRPKAV